MHRTASSTTTTTTTTTTSTTKLLLLLLAWSMPRYSHQIVFLEEEDPSECTGPAGAAGRCVAISQCRPIQTILKNPSPHVFQHLQNLTCGFQQSEPMICCPPDDDAEASSTSTTAPSGGVSVRPIAARPPDYAFLSTTCGRATPNRQRRKRVVGGHDARPGSWPWLALLLYRQPKTDVGGVFRGCSGVLISDHHVVTSAACAAAEHLYKVRLGVHRWDPINDSRIDDDDDDVFGIGHIVAHESYKAKTSQNDVAILYLSRTVVFTAKIQTICLPQDRFFRENDFAGEKAWIAGWGSTKEGGPPTEVLKEAELQVVSSISCRLSYKGVPNFVIDDSVLCAGGDESKDSCSIDIGGPLMLPFGPDGRFYLLGVVSNGLGCGRIGFPSVSMHMGHYIDWIVKTLTQRQLTQSSSLKT